MAGSPYAEFEPREELRPWVRLLWTYEDAAPSDVVQRIPPDGCPELVVHFATPYEEQRADGRFAPQPRAIFAGQMTRPICLRAVGPVSCVGMRFHPDGGAAWLGASMETATDKRLDVTARVDAACAGVDRIGWLQGPVAFGVGPDAGVRAAVKRLEAGDDADEMDAAERRRMQRLFLKEVGVSERMLRSVFRFRKVFDHAAKADGAWLDAALAAGYFDQPQMARDFQRFLGCTATTWAREQVELARAIAAPRG